MSQTLESSGIIAGVSAAEALWSSNKNNPETTMAAHVEHLRWSLTNANEALQGKPYQGNWSESWNTPETDKIKRDRLRKELRTEFETLMKNLRKQEDIGGDT